jgi:hypothetical protein
MKQEPLPHRYLINLKTSDPEAHVLLQVTQLLPGNAQKHPP